MKTALRWGLRLVALMVVLALTLALGFTLFAVSALPPLQPWHTELLRSEPLARFIRERGSEPAPTTGPEFDRFIASEIRKWGTAVKASGASVD